MKHTLDWNTDHDTLTDTVLDMGTKHISFSIFDTHNGDWGDGSRGSWKISAPDILSEKPVFEGDVRLKCTYWRMTNDVVTSPVLTNPTWKDLILAVDKMLGGGDGIFLEGFDFEGFEGPGIQVYDLSIGS